MSPMANPNKMTRKLMDEQSHGLTLFWFRRDLRLDDNAALYEALKSIYPVLPVFIFDNHILDKLPDKADKRVSFIYKALQIINETLMSKGSSVLVLKGDPLKQIQELVKKYPVRAVYCNHDYEPYARERDQAVAEWLASRNIPFYSFKDQVIFEKSDILKNDGTPYTVFTPYSKIWKHKLNREMIRSFPVENHTDRFYRTVPFLFPPFEETGFQQMNTPSPVPQVDEEIVLNYDLTRNLPAMDGTTRLSVHLRFGTVSIRHLVKTALRLNGEWLNELIWREFFMMILYHFPHVEKSSFKPKYNFIAWRNNEEEFHRWCEGETGYPMVDAGMRELNETGFMHNRVRMITASFLTKHLLIDWRWGEAYFAEKLLDYELSSNNGNWQWAAGCGCDAAPYFRIFNPYEQQKKFDPEMVYTNKWVKNLNRSDYPSPVVDHAFARERALLTYKKCLG
jgi:deoxyribodipyrimidine photo-lyase